MEFTVAKYCSRAQTVLCCNDTIYCIIQFVHSLSSMKILQITSVTIVLYLIRSRSKCYYGNIFIAERDSVQSHLSTLYKNPGDQVQVWLCTLYSYQKVFGKAGDVFLARYNV